MAVFGLPFLIAGLAVTLLSLGLLPLQNADEVPWFGRPLMLLMGTVFSVVGGGLVFGRTWTTLSSADRTVVRRYGLLIPMSTATHRIDEYAGVLLDFVRGDSDSADQFPVSLKSPTGRHLRLFSSTQYAEARERATAVAGLFNFEIEDASTDHAVRLSAAQANLSFQHRYRMEHRQVTTVVPPSVMRSSVNESHGNVIIVIPARRVHPAAFVVFFVPVGVAAWLVRPVHRFFRESQTPDPVSWMFLGFLTLAFGIIPAYAGLRAFLRSRLGRTTVTVSTGGIRIDERGVWKTKTIASLPSSDIVDVDFSTTESMIASARHTSDQVRRDRPAAGAPPPGDGTERALRALRKLGRGGGVTIKTRQGLTTVGGGLEDEEIEYLHHVIRQALVSGRAGSG
jgi:hypothetical protein